MKLWALGASLVAVVIAWLLASGDTTSGDVAEDTHERRSLQASAGKAAKPTVEQQPSIAGIVRSREGTGPALAGARVCAWLLGGDGRVDEPLATRCVLGGSDGRYRLTPLQPGRYRVVASAPGKIPDVWKDPEKDARELLQLGSGEVRDDVDFALAQGGQELGGSVVDVAGGEIQGALVIATGPGMFAREPVATAVSDEQGRFSMWVASGEYGLLAVADGYAPTRHRAQTPNQTIELRLTPESVLVGRVVDGESGNGIAGVSITPDAGPHASPVVTSAEDGSFRVGGLAPGIYQPEAIGPGVYGRAASPVHVGLGQTSESIELRVFPAHRLRGQIVAIDGEQERGCADGRLNLNGAGVFREAEADAEGWVVLEGVPAGRHELRVSCPEQFESLEQRLELHGDLDEQRWAVEVGGIRIAGRVVDDQGRPVASVYIDSTGPRGDGHDLTMADGKFELRAREAGMHHITAKLRGQADPVAELELEVGEAPIEDIELSIGEVASLRGQVVDPDGNPVAGMRVALCDARGRPEHWAITDGDGRFGFAGQAPGRWWVALHDEIDMDAKGPFGEPVELHADEIAEIVRTTERANGSIRGTVSAEGGPVDDAWIVAGRSSVDALIRDWELGPILCNVDGSFVLEGLAEGTWAVRAFRKQGGEASQAGLELGTTVSLELAATASVAGRVQYRDGSTPAHFEIEASSREHQRSHSFYRSEGVFELAELPAGKWTLAVATESGSAELEIDLDEGQQLTELVIELETRVTIRGRAVDSRTGAPVRSVELSYRASRSFQREARLAEDGSFELEGLRPGRVELAALPRDWRSAPYPLQRVVLDVPAEPAVQELGELLLAGGKLEPGQSRGTLGFEFRLGGCMVNKLDDIDECAIEVTEVDRGGPADAAGLRVGDRISRFDGASVEGRDATRMGIYMRRIAADEAIVLERRDDSKITIIAAPLSSAK